MSYMRNELDKQKLRKWFSIPYTGLFLSFSRAYVVSSSHCEHYRVKNTEFLLDKDNP